MKIKNSLLAIFDKIWLMTKGYIYIAFGLLPDFGVTLKIHKKSNLDRNQLKLEK